MYSYPHKRLDAGQNLSKIIPMVQNVVRIISINLFVLSGRGFDADTIA